MVTPHGGGEPTLPSLDAKRLTTARSHVPVDTTNRSAEHTEHTGHAEHAEHAEESRRSSRLGRHRSPRTVRRAVASVASVAPVRCRSTRIRCTRRREQLLRPTGAVASMDKYDRGLPLVLSCKLY